MSILAAPVDWTPGKHYGGLGYGLQKALEGIGAKLGDINVKGGIAARGVNIDFNLATSAAQQVEDHINGKTTYTLVTPNYIALCTGAVLASDTGVTITTTNNVEANYTSYARLSMAAADYPAAAAGAAPPTATSSPPVGAKTWPGCTGGSAVVTNWCIIQGTAVTRANAGTITYYGTCTSTTISTTQTPPSLAAGGLTLTAT